MSGGFAVAATRLGQGARSLSALAESRFITLAGLLIAAGVVLRLILIGTTTSGSESWNLLYPGYGDGRRYSQIAESILETGTFGYAGRPTAFRSPAYPALIALTWQIFGTTLTPIRLLQVGMFVLMTLVYAGAVARRFGRLAAAFTAALMSLHPLLAFLSTEVATECLYMVLESGVFALSLLVLEPIHSPARRAWIAFAAGLCCGAGALTRPNMYPTFLLVGALIGWRGARDRGGWRSWTLPLAALVLGNYLVLGPWLIRNQRAVGAPVIATNIEYNLFRGTFDVVGAIPFGQAGEDIMTATFRDHQVLYEGEIEDATKSQLPFDEVTNEKRARAEAWAFIRSHPGRWLWERLRNTAYLWLNLQWEMPRLRNPVVMLASVVVTLIYYFLLAAAVAGSLSLGRKDADPARRRFMATTWLFILSAMPVVLTIVGKRYRVAMIDPFLILLASTWAASLVARVGRDGPAPLRVAPPA